MAKEYDYIFVSRLLSELFSDATLANVGHSANKKKTAYARLNEVKYKFLKDTFEERVKNTKYSTQRLETLPSLINKRCAQIRKKIPI